MWAIDRHRQEYKLNMRYRFLIACFMIVTWCFLSASFFGIAFADEQEGECSANSRSVKVTASDITVPAYVISANADTTSLRASVTYSENFVKGDKARFFFSIEGNTLPLRYRICGLQYDFGGENWEDIIDISHGIGEYAPNSFFEVELYSAGSYCLTFEVAEGDAAYDTRFQIKFTVNEDGNFKTIHSVINEVVDQCWRECEAKGDASDYAKALWLNDWIIENGEYDDSLIHCGAVSLLGGGKGTHESYHNAYAMLLEKAGIETKRVDVPGDDSVWTGAKLNGQWYNIDTACNDASQPDPLDINVHRLYFALPSNIMKLVHKNWDGNYTVAYPERAPFEATSLEDNYFIRSGEISQYTKPYTESTSGDYSVRAQLSANKTNFSLPIVNSEWPNEVKCVLYTLVAQQLESINWGPNVGKMTVVYEDGRLNFGHPVSVSGAQIINVRNMTFSGVDCIIPDLSVSIGGTTLVKGVDYDVSYKNNVNVGTATVVIAGKGNYCGTKEATFKITPKALPQPSLSATSFVYDGKAKTPSVTVKDGSKSLIKDKDYSISYANNTGIGTAKVTITGKGNYSGTKTLSFKIVASSSSSNGNSSGSSNDSSGTNNSVSGDAAILTPTKAPTVTGTWKKTKGKWWFSYDAKSKAVQKKSWPANEWVAIKGKRYHFDSKGYMHANWYKARDTWYYLGSDGAMKTGWQKVKGKWYYLNPSDGKMKTGKQIIDKKMYFLKSDGAMRTGWVSQGKDWYYCNASGAMTTGWQKVKGKWYYLNPSDGKMKTGFYDVGKARYYSDGSGAMKTGWQKIKNQWYYFNKSGAMQKSKWISGKYWVDADGVMAVNTWVGKYHVNSSGKWDGTR